MHANKRYDITPWRRNEQCFLRCERLEPSMSQLGHSRRGRLSGKLPHVRLAPKVTDALRRRELTRCANQRHSHRGKTARYSITSSARASTDAGTVRLSALAVLRLMTSSYFVGACTGMSAGFSPLRIRST